MESSIQLANRLKEVLLDGKWIANTNYKEKLSKITWEEANQKILSLNTISLLTFHINYYVAGVLNVFEEGSLDIRDQYSFDAPPIKSSKDWDERRNKLASNAEKLTEYVKQLTIKQLDEDFVDKKYGSYRRNIEGMIEHCYYHLGQISLIAKMIRK